MSDIILSIKPKYAEMILQGTKTVELRKSLPKEMPSKVYLYATTPIKRIVGWFTCTNLIRAAYLSKSKIIYLCNTAGVTEEEMYKCFGGKYISYYNIRSVDRCDIPLPTGVKAPRNFVYLKNPIPILHEEESV